MFRIFQFVRSQHVIAERKLKRRKVSASTRIKFGQFGEQQIFAARIKDQRIKTHVKSQLPIIDTRGTDLEERPFITGKYLNGHPFPHAGESPAYFIRRESTQFHDLDPVRFDILKDLLFASGKYNGTQHVMSLNEPLPGPIKALQVKVYAFELDIIVAGDSA
jgi:hypothetical protein